VTYAGSQSRGSHAYILPLILSSCPKSQQKKHSRWWMRDRNPAGTLAIFISLLCRAVLSLSGKKHSRWTYAGSQSRGSHAYILPLILSSCPKSQRKISSKGIQSKFLKIKNRLVKPIYQPSTQKNPNFLILF